MNLTARFDCSMLSLLPPIRIISIEINAILTIKISNSKFLCVFCTKDSNGLEKRLTIKYLLFSEIKIKYNDFEKRI